MNNVKEFVRSSLGNVKNISHSVKSFKEYFLNEVNKLEFDTEPPYSKIQSKLSDTLRSLGHGANALDNFRLFSNKNPPRTPSTQVKKSKA